MSDGDAAGAGTTLLAPADGTNVFLENQIGQLEPYDFVILTAAGHLLDSVEVMRREDGGFTLTLPPRPPSVAFSAEQRAAMERLGFTGPAEAGTGAAWRATAADAATAASTAAVVLHQFDEQAPAIDVHHGSRRPEHEAGQKLAALRSRIASVITDLLGREPSVDADGDYTFRFDSVNVYVAARAGDGGLIVVRVFAITNVGVEVTPQLALFLARLNFGLAFGRFTMDLEHRAVWFDETLLGDHATDDEIRLTIGIVAGTANEWDDRIKTMFGGATGGETAPATTNGAATPNKPGEGGYL